MFIHPGRCIRFLRRKNRRSLNNRIKYFRKTLAKVHLIGHRHFFSRLTRSMKAIAIMLRREGEMAPLRKRKSWERRQMLFALFMTGARHSSFPSTIWTMCFENIEFRNGSFSVARLANLNHLHLLRPSFFFFYLFYSLPFGKVLFMIQRINGHFWLFSIKYT